VGSCGFGVKVTAPTGSGDTLTGSPRAWGTCHGPAGWSKYVWSPRDTTVTTQPTHGFITLTTITRNYCSLTNKSLLFSKNLKFFLFTYNLECMFNCQLNKTQIWVQIESIITTFPLWNVWILFIPWQLLPNVHRSKLSVKGLRPSWRAVVS